MHKIFPICLMLLAVSACKQEQAAPPDNVPVLEPVSYTLYSEKSELFVEFKPLVVGQVSRFASHLTILGENFLPFTEGVVTLSLLQGEKGLKNVADSVSSPGIFRLALQPVRAGVGKLVFDIQTKGFSDRFVIDSVVIYADEQSAIASQPEAAADNDLSFLKEQAWKIPFANTPVIMETMYDVVKATGKIIGAPGDEVTIAAKSNGMVKFIGGMQFAGGQVRAGQSLFNVTGGEIAFENVDAAKDAARAELTTAKFEFNRANTLIKDQLITQTEFQTAKLRVEQAQINLNNLGKNYGSGGNNLTSPISGFFNQILVTEGQYVTIGQPLATVSKNQRIMLTVDVSLKDAGKINSVSEANFMLAQSDQLYNTKKLNGKLLGTGKNVSPNSPFITVQFQLDKKPELLPGSFAEVYLKTAPLFGVTVIPLSSLIEEQGNFYAFVQTKGESFQKRELKLGVNDGQWVQVISGVSVGERVVSTGGYQIKLSQESGTMPAHGHEH